MRRSFFGVLFCVLLSSTMLSTGAAADDITLSGVIHFNSLDGSADDHDGAADGTFTVDDGNLVIDGTIQCNDDLPLSGSGSACPIRLSVSGDLVLNPGGAIVAENRRGSGSGGEIELEVGGDLVLHGPSGGLSGASVSSSRTSGSGGVAGAISATVAGSLEMEAGSTVAANNPTGLAGAIEIEAGGAIRIAGLIVSGPSSTLLPDRRKSGAVLDGGNSGQKGGSIVLRSISAEEPGIRIESTGTVVSQGRSSGSQLVLLESCGIEVRGLLATISENDTPARVALRSGKGILVDGTDLADVPGPRSGRLRVDSTVGGAAAHLVDLFAQGDIQVLGPPASVVDFVAVSANPGTQLQRTGGSINAISLGGALLAHGNVAEAGRVLTGNKGGKINLQASGDVDLEDAHLRAVGGYTTSSNLRRGGQISVRSFQGEVRWTFGTGDVRPTGSGTTAASRGTIKLTACTGIDTTGTSFPVLGSPVAPFPMETDGVCSPTAPSLPAGEPPLPVCNVPPIADGQSVITDEDADVTITLTGSDPSGDSLTFSIVTPPAHGSLGPLTSPTATSVQVVYTPDADYNGSDSFVFQVEDGNGGTDTATVEITIEAVDDAPEAVDDSATVTEGSGPSSIDVLANDTDIDGGPKSIGSVTQPANGTVEIAVDGLSLTYKPNEDYCNNPPGTALETFTYTLSPAGANPTATVEVTVECVDDAPTAVTDSATVPEDSLPTTIDVLANDTDPDGGPKSIGSVTQPANGLVTLAGDGLSLAYKPNANYCNTPPGTLLETFTYTLSPVGSNPTATVTVAVTCVDDAPEAMADAATVAEDAPPTTIDVLANDTDIDGGAKSVASVTQPANGVVAIAPGGTGLTYKPNANYCNNPPGTAPDTFTYTLSPAGSTPTATVSVLVTCINDAPVLADPTIDYKVLGNTQLRVGESTEGASVFHLRDNQDVDEKSLPSDVDGPGPITVVPFSGNTGKGDLVLNSDGTFTYEPNAGFEGTDVITFQVTDNGSPAAVASGTLTITVSHTVWYVHDVTGENNPEADDTGRSTNAFEDLEDVQSVLTDNDYIYVFKGNSATTPHGGIRIDKTGVKLIGAGVALEVPGFDSLIDAGSPARIVNTVDVPGQEDHGVAVDATAASLSGVEVRGLNISGRDNGIEVTSAGANSVGVTISNNTVSSDGTTGLEGIDVNANSTGTTTVVVSSTTLTGRGTAFDARTGAAGALRIDFSDNLNILSATGSGVVIDGSGGGTTTITGFMGNTVDPNTAGTGIRINTATFDQTPGGAFETVLGGSTTVGASGGAGSGVGGPGVVLTDIAGDLAFAALNVYADNGTGLQISGTGAVNVGGGTGTRVTVGSGMAIFEAMGGPAVDVSNATIDLRPSRLMSTTATTGVSLVNVSDGTTPAVFSVGSNSSITANVGASGPAFNVSGGNAEIKYGGPITNNGSGRAVSITSWSGDDASDDLALSGAIDENGAGILVNGNSGSRSITFSGGMDIDTGANEGFAATSNTNSGGLHITGTNTIDTTTATALRVTSTPIGNSGLTFRSLTAGTGSGSNGVGIVLDGTGTGASNGGLTVTGNSGPGTGGTIQHKTGADGSTTAGIGIFLKDTKNVSLSWMQLNDFDNSAIAGRNVHGFSLQNSVVNGTIGTTNVGAEGPIAFGLSNPGGVDGLQGTGLIRNTKISGGVEHNLEFYNQSGTMNLTIAGINAVSEGANPNSPADDVADCIIEENSAALGGDGIQIEMQGTATATVVVDRCLFRDNKSQAVQVAANNSSAVTVTIDESRVRRFDQGNEGFILSNGGDGDLTALVSNNHVNGIGGTTIFVGQTPGNATAASVLNATITGNVINQPTTATNHGISALLTSTVGQLSQARVRIDGNTVANNSTAGTVRGIIVDTPDATTSPVFHATVTNNTVSVGDNVSGVSGIVVQGRQSSDICANIGGNTVTFPNGNPGVFGLRARQVSPSTYDLEQSAGCTGTAAAVLACRNPGSTTEVLGILTVVPTGACLLPVTP